MFCIENLQALAYLKVMKWNSKVQLRYANITSTIQSKEQILRINEAQEHDNPCKLLTNKNTRLKEILRYAQMASWHLSEEFIIQMTTSWSNIFWIKPIELDKPRTVEALECSIIC